jgi:hypothetical protein
MKLIFSTHGLDSEVVEKFNRAAQVGRMQWRGSPDGIVWGPWSTLTHLTMLLPGGPYFAVQARIRAGGKWHTSPIETY